MTWEVKILFSKNTGIFYIKLKIKFKNINRHKKMFPQNSVSQTRKLTKIKT